MAKPRPRPPEDISPEEFFTRWVPASVDRDSDRRAKLARMQAAIVFEITAPERSVHTVYIDSGRVRGAVGAHEDPDLRVELDEETWRALNRGGLSAPEAMLRRRVKIHGDWVLALRLHLILA